MSSRSPDISSEVARHPEKDADIAAHKIKTSILLFISKNLNIKFDSLICNCGYYLVLSFVSALLFFAQASSLCAGSTGFSLP